MHQLTLLSVVVAVLAALPTAQAGIYTKNSPVLQLDARSYEQLIAKSNHTTVVEFYAPWCGHCQQLKPAFEKAARNLDGLAKVAAVDCDDDANKPFCSSMGIQGFPTLKIVRPSKKPGGKPVVEDYQGARSASAIVQAVVDKMNNHVTRIADKDLDTFLQKDGPKAILFTNKGTTSALLKSLAIDFLGVVSVGQIRDKEKSAVERFKVERFPTFVLIPGPDEDPVVYSGDLDKKDMVKFLQQVGEPNPDAALANSNEKSKDNKKKPSSSKTKSSQSESKAKPEEAPEASTTQAAPGSTAPAIIPIVTVDSNEMLARECLVPQGHGCILALVPSQPSDKSKEVVMSLSKLSSKYIHGKRHFLPFFSVPNGIMGQNMLRQVLGLTDDVEVIAISLRRNWWVRYTAADFDAERIEAWVDGIRMGEAKKSKLPTEFLEPPVAHKDGTPDEAAATEMAEATEAVDPDAEVETEPPEVSEDRRHEEL